MEHRDDMSLVHVASKLYLGKPENEKFALCDEKSLAK